MMSWWYKLRGSWPTLLREHAEGVIEEAHMDAEKGLHFNGSPKPGFFSTQECACLCGNLLTKKAADNGHTFIWGHRKNINGKVHDKPLTGKTGPAPHAKVISNTNMDSIETFLSAQLKLLKNQISEQESICHNAQDMIKTLSHKEAKVVRAIEALKEL